MNALRLSVVSLAVLAASAFGARAQAPSQPSAAPAAAAPAAAQSVQIALPPLTNTPATGLKSISGTVTSVHGPEAGVWVIAETNELPTKFAKIVVTDDKGRYLIPDLPLADYSVFVRGYGLVDSPKVKGIPGTQHLDLAAIPAPNAADAAAYYPAIYWYSMVKIPPADQFGGKSSIPAKETFDDYLTNIKNRGCVGCHQLGMLSTRTVPAAFASLDPEQAWIRRIQSGLSGSQMVDAVGPTGGVPLHYFGDWTASIAKGALPTAKPPRPQGVERNIVITEWEWGTADTYLHDLISTDKRNPTVNAYGPLWGSTEYSTDEFPVLDPNTNTASSFHMPVRDADTPESLGQGGGSPALKAMQPSAYWGDRKIWTNHANSHNAMFDENGLLWFTAVVRAPANPAVCKQGSSLESAQVFPIPNSSRQFGLLDPKTGKYTFVDTCFSTQHLQFGFDKDDTLYGSGGGPVLGWVDTKKFLASGGDVTAAEGWAPLIADANGNGKRDAFVEPNQPTDPTKDKRLPGGFYAIMPSPVDGSIWGTVGVFGGVGGVERVVLGDDPSKTAIAELYGIPKPGFGPRGGDIDSKGRVWVSLASGHLGEFDRSKCKDLKDGPATADGTACPEGWTFYQYPGPGFAGIGKNSAEASYYTWVDQHNTLGLGNDVVVSTGNENDALLVLVNGKWVVMRVPYPMSFYTKGLDGRIDDPNGGWKARGIWTTSGDRTPWLHEGGKGGRPVAFHFQVRPNPLAD